MQTLIHIGCPKTGTTSLQQHLFRKLPQTHYLGHYSKLDPRLHQIIKGRRPAEKLLPGWSHMVAMAPADTRLLLYSHEKFSYFPVTEAPDVARKLYEMTGPADILITIRRQQDICVSTYFNFVATGYGHDFNTFMHNGLEWLNPQNSERLHRGPERLWGSWLFDELFEAWAAVFGKVHVLPLEAWRQQPQQATETLARALGMPAEAITLPVARSRSRASNAPWRRYLPRPLAEWLKTATLPDWFNRRVEEQLHVDLTPEQRETIAQAYGASNRKLAERSGWDLRQLGYPGWPAG